MMRECKRLMKRLYVMVSPGNVAGNILAEQGRLMLKFAHNGKCGERAEIRTFGGKRVRCYQYRDAPRELLEY
jgi:hypothetical protein